MGWIELERLSYNERGNSTEMMRENIMIEYSGDFIYCPNAYKMLSWLQKGIFHYTHKHPKVVTSLF